MTRTFADGVTAAAVDVIRLVLAVDQSMVRDAFAELLGMEKDIEVVGTASNGEEALDLVRDSHPDLLLTDIEMPVMSGLDLAAAIQSINDPPRVVIVTTFSRQARPRNGRPDPSSHSRRTGGSLAAERATTKPA